MEKLTVCFKNFQRSNFLPATIASIRYFCPDVEFHSLNLCKSGPEEYQNYETITDLNVWYERTKYVNTQSDVYDGKVTSGFQNQKNIYYFLEGYNLIIDRFKDLETKLLILAEDHFFTTGATLQELIEKPFDFSYAAWDGGDDNSANASIVCLRPKPCLPVFPLLEPSTNYGGVESFLSDKLVKPIKSLGLSVHKITTRVGLNYHGDGFYSNDSSEIRKALKDASIL